MNEMELLTRLRDEVPADAVPARAETALLTAIQAEESPANLAPGSLRARGLAALGLAERGPAARGTGAPGRRGPRRVWRLVLAGVVTLALAAGVFAAQAIQSGGSGPARISVKELAYRAAAAAAAQPNVPPGQWVYWREKQVGGKPDGIFQVWTTADSRKAAYVYKGKVKFVPCVTEAGTISARGCGQFIGQPGVFAAPPPYGGVTWGYVGGKIPITYAALDSLPRSPEALNRYLGRLHLPGWGSAAAREFEVIRELLISYVMPPALTAELYRALGGIPGVTVDDHAVDVAGRRGIGFGFQQSGGSGGGKEEIILNPRTYRLMGDTLQGPNGHADSGTAILRRALVSGPGVRP